MSTGRQVSFVNPLGDASWDARVAALPGATVFHGAAWTRCLSDTYGFSPCHAVMREGGDVVAVQPLMEVRKLAGRPCGVALPFTDACPALAREGAQRIELLDAIVREAGRRGWARVELRGPVADSRAIPSACFCEHEVVLGPSEDDHLARCHSSVRRAVRKASSSGLRAECGVGDVDVAAFYRLLTVTRRRHGLPPPPRAFLDAIRRHLLATGDGTIVTVRREDRAVAAALFLRWGRSGLFKFGASAGEGREVRANDFALLEGFRWCRAAGCERVSLGRSAVRQAGLLRFKRGWAGVESPLDYHSFDLDAGRFVAGRGDAAGWYTHVFRRLPIPLLQWAGRVLYRQAA